MPSTGASPQRQATSLVLVRHFVWALPLLQRIIAIGSQSSDFRTNEFSWKTTTPTTLTLLPSSRQIMDTPLRTCNGNPQAQEVFLGQERRHLLNYSLPLVTH